MDKERAGIQSVEVGFALLAALAQAGGALMLKELAARADMSAAKAHRYLVSFQRLGLVLQHESSSQYDLGPAALQLGLAALARQEPLRLARAQLPALQQALGHTLALAVWGNHGPTIVHWQPAARAVPVSLRLGDVMPLLSSATGRCFAAWLAPERSAALLAQELAAQPARADLPASWDECRTLWQQLRAQGAASVEGSLLPGVSALAVPIFDASGQLCLCLTALGPSHQFDASAQGDCARLLRACAQQLTRDLGGEIA